MHAPRHLQDLIRAEVHAREHVAPVIDDVGETRVVDHDRVEPLHVERALPRRGHREEVRLLHAALEERTDHANRLAAVIELRRDPRETGADRRRRLLDARARREEDADTAPLLRHLREEFVVEESQRIGAHDFDLRGLRRIERAALDDARGIEISRVKGRIDRRREPDEAASHALAERKAEFELGAGLVDLVDHQRVLRTDVAVLEPPSRDSGRDDHDVPRGRFRRRLAFTVDHADPQFRGAEQRVRDGADRERLARAGTRDDPEAAADAAAASRPGSRFLLAKFLGERGELGAVRAPERGLEIQSEREFDRFAGGARGRDDDQAARRARSHERVVVGREVRVANSAEVF